MAETGGGTQAARARRDLVLVAIAGVFALVVVSLMAWRLRHGIDFTDEAFYAGIPARFALGDRPFVDEMNVAQGAGIVVWPFVALWHAIAGFSGLFAFLRTLQLIFYVGVGGILYRLVRTRLPRAPAVLVAAACVPFLPYGLCGLSYNTVGAGLFSIGVFVAARRSLLFRRDDPARPFFRAAYFWSGFALGMATLAYQTLILAVVLTGVMVAVFADRRLRSFLHFVAGGAAFVLLVSPIFLRAGTSHIHDFFTYLNGESGVGSPFSRRGIETAWNLFVSLHPNLWKHALGIAVLILFAQRFPLLGGLLIPLVPLWTRDTYAPGNIGGLYYFADMGLYTPLVALALRDRRTAFTLVGSIWLPSCLAGLAISLSSGNGARAAGLGLYPSALCCAFLLALWLDETVKRWPTTALGAFAQLGPATMAYVLVQYAIADDAVYRDGKIHELTARVTEGPYKGLLTTPTRKRWLAGFDEHLRQYANSGDRALFYYDFPAGYMFVDKRPLVSSAWIQPAGPVRSRFETRYFRTHMKPGEAVFRFGSVSNSYVDLEVQRDCEKVGSGDGYEIWRVR